MASGDGTDRRCWVNTGVVTRRSLKLAALGAGLTLNGLRPAPGENPLSLPSFFASWLTNELAPHNTAITIGHLSWLLRRGRRRDAADFAAIALDFGSLAGLAVILRQSLRVRGVVTDALAEVFGRSAAESDPAPWQPEPATPWSQVLMPWRYKDPAVRRIADIDYVGDGKRRHRLDIYLPRELTDQPMPVLLQVHGGGWVIGNKEEQGLPLMGHLAARGWICVACNYPLSPKAKWPEHLVAIKQALAWTKEHIAEYGGDPSWVAVTGGSAGGHLAAMTALTANDPKYQPGFESADTSVQACVPFYGAYDLANVLETKAGDKRHDYFLSRVMFGKSLEAARDATPLLHVSGDAPPFFVIHGVNDSLVPVAEARELVRRLREANADTVAYAELPGAQHAFDVFASIRSAHVIRGVERFLATIRERAGGASTVPQEGARAS